MSQDDLLGHVDIVSAQEITGWATRGGDSRDPLFVDIVVNGRRVATVAAELHRADLVEAGISDGQSGFHFDPSRHLDRAVSRVDVVFSGTGRCIPGGSASIESIGHLASTQPQDPEERARLTELSKERWRAVENAEGLTWGRLMSGDSFVDAVAARCSFEPTLRLCELGPGYGRLLRTILDRGLAFESYVGIELSEGRVSELQDSFADDPRARFRVGDINDFKLERPVDLLFCSSTFEHLYPDCSMGIANVAANLGPGGVACIDFILQGSDPSQSGEWFEEASKTFIRVYSSKEIENHMRAAGLLDVGWEILTLGEGSESRIERIFAAGAKPGPRPVRQGRP